MVLMKIHFPKLAERYQKQLDKIHKTEVNYYENKFIKMYIMFNNHIFLIVIKIIRLFINEYRDNTMSHIFLDYLTRFILAK